LCLTGRYSGGTAKTAVVSSGLMGMIQGSSVTNVLTTGTFTIPAMKKAGFQDYYAAAVETVASCGGQIMPPVMGAAAFIMADMTGIPYSKIIVHAIVPAVLYYLCCMMQVHFRSKKANMKGMPKHEVPKIWPLIKDKGAFILPIIMMLVLLIKGYTAMRTGFVSISTLLFIGLILSKDRRKVFVRLIEQLKEVPYIMSSIAPAVAVAGIIVGIFFMTGLGERLSAVVIRASMGNLLIGLFLAMIVSIILGMGMPTSAAYILMGTLIAPGLVKLGASTIQAHLFVLYFACMSMLTPPVAIAAYAAASLAKSNPNKTGFAAWKLALAAFIVPYMFVYGEELLLVGNPYNVIRSVITASIGCIALAAALEGYLIGKITGIQRLMLGVAALIMIETNLWTDLVGFLLIFIVVSIQVRNKKKVLTV
jgi:TRAP transporter 4TM/12TM fusion protein